MSRRASRAAGCLMPWPIRRFPCYRAYFFVNGSDACVAVSPDGPKRLSPHRRRRLLNRSPFLCVPSVLAARAPGDFLVDDFTGERGDVEDGIMPHVNQNRRDGLDDSYKEFDEDFDDQSDDDDSCDERQSQREQEPSLQMLDDNVLFGFLKKMACTAFRQLITSAVGPSGFEISVDNVVNTTSCGTSDARVTGTRLNTNYFSEIVESLSPQKRTVIETYGFKSLLLFDKCAIPLPFASWIADHMQVNSSDSVVRNKSIPITAHTVRDVLGIPLGGRPIRKSDSEKGKRGFLGMLKLTSLPTVKAFGDKLLKDDISDEDELVRSFLIVALATFLCPNASPYPSTEYLLPLVAVKSAEKWDWSKFVHYWLFKQIRKYHSRKKKPQHQTRTLGGCLYLICVAYLDFLAFGPHDQLPSTLPRITVWKKDMIKQFSELDRVDGNVFGKRPILPLKSTCFARKVASRTPSPVCIPDGSNFKKVLLERVPANFSPEIHAAKKKGCCSC